MTATPSPLDGLTAELEDLAAAHADPDRLVTDLLGRGWVAACRDAAERDHPFLDSPQDDQPGSPRALAFALFADEGAEYTARARAILMAACTARAHLHHEGRDADRWRAEAHRLWADSAPDTPAETAAALADDLTEWFRGEYPAPVRSVSVPVLLHEGDPDELGIGHLVLMQVDDALGRLLPDPGTMAFAPAQRITDAGLGVAFAWARGREEAPPGAGVRWRLLTEAAVPALEAPGLAAGGAAAAGLMWLWRRSPVPARWRRTDWPHEATLVHAGLDTAGRLLPGTGLERVAAGVTRRHVGLVVAKREADEVRGATQADGRRVTGASHVRAALGQVRDAGGRRRRVALGVAVTALTVAAVVVAAVAGLVLDDGTTAQRAGSQALLLALGSADRQADEPDRALLDALAARALDPSSTAARGALLAAVNTDQRTEKVLATGVNDPKHIALDATGGLVALAGRDGSTRVIRSATGATVPLPPGTGPATALAFARTAGGPLALVGDGRVSLWSPGSAAAPRSLAVSGRRPVSVAFSADDRRFAVGCEDGSLLLWDLSSPDGAPRTVRAHKAAVRAVAFTPSGDAVISTGDDRSVRSSRWSDAEAGRVWQGLSGPGRHLAVRDDGSVIYALTRSGLHFLAGDLGRQLRKPVAVPVGGQLLYRKAERPRRASFGARTESLLLAFINGVVEVPPDPEGAVQDDGRTLSASTAPYARSSLTDSIAALSGDERLLAVPTRTGAVRIHRQQAGRDVYPGIRWPRAVHPVPGARRQLVVAGLGKMNGAVGLVDSDTGRVLAHVRLGTFNYRASAYVASAHALVVGGAGGLFTVTVNGDSLTLGTPVRATADSGVHSVISDEARHRLIVGWADRLTVQDTAHGLTAPLRTIQIPPKHQALALAPDGRRLFTATGGGLYALDLDKADPWAARENLARRLLYKLLAFPDGVVVAASVDGQVLRYRRDPGQGWSASPLPGHRGAILALVAHHGKAVSIGNEGNLRVTDAAAGTLLATLPMPTAYGRFSTFGTAGNGSALRVFDAWHETAIDIPLDDEAVREQACAQLSASTPRTVGDVWAQAPAGLRDRPLCPAA